MYRLLAKINRDYVVITDAESAENLIELVKAVKRNDIVVQDTSRGRSPQFGFVPFEKARSVLKIETRKLKRLIRDKKLDAVKLDGTFYIDGLSLERLKKSK